MTRPLNVMVLIRLVFLWLMAINCISLENRLSYMKRRSMVDIPFDADLIKRLKYFINAIYSNVLIVGQNSQIHFSREYTLC